MIKTKEEMLGKIVRFHSRVEPYKAKLYLITDGEYDSFSHGKITYETVVKWAEESDYNIEFFNSMRVNKGEEVTKNELYDSWEKELGRNKAILLSCCYPVKIVIEMTEEEAEAEIEAIGALQ